MSNSRKTFNHDPRKRDSFYGLGVRHDEEDHNEAIDLVMELLEWLRNDLYSSSKRMRVHIYYELLRQTSDLMEVDGGPTFALELFRRTAEDCGLEENESGTKVIGPFLTKEQLKALRRGYRPYIEVPGTPKWGKRPKKRTRR